MAKSSAWMQTYRQTPRGRAVLAWHNLSANATICGITVAITRDEFVAWYVTAVTAWTSSERPAVVRCDRNRPYMVGNLELVTVSDASKRHPRNKNTHAPDGQAWCSTCQDYRDIGDFSPAPSRPPRFTTSLCKSCKAKEAREAKARRNSK